MAEEKKQSVAEEFTLPPNVVGQPDLSRLIREAEALDGELEAQKVRGQATTQPKLSQAMTDLLESNDITEVNGKTLTIIRDQLRKLKEHLPVVHFTFAAEVEPEELQKLVAWLRKEVHPRALVSVGVQPSLVGGVYMRTPNHVYDFSLRAMLDGKRDIISKDLEKIGAVK